MSKPPPLTVFSAICEPLAALQVLQATVSNISITGQGENWREVSGTWKRGLLKSSLKLKVRNDPDYYAEPAFALQRNGLANYLRRFPGVEKLPALFEYIGHLRFALSFQADPEWDGEDPRYEALFSVADTLDGIVFAPHAVLDCAGRSIIAVDGSRDPQAVIPVAAGPPPPSLESLMANSQSTDVEDEEPRLIRPPSAVRAARRLQVLIAGAVRGFVEKSAGDRNGRQRYVERMLAALKRSGAWDEAEPEELQSLQTAVGSLSDDDIWSMTWQSEAAAMLAWALGLHDLPAYDEQVNPQTIQDLTGLNPDDNGDGARAEAIVEDAALRSHEELQAMGYRILTIHWRLREFSQRPVAMDFRTFPQRAKFAPLDTTLAKFIGDDLAIGGKPISKCKESEWRPVAGVLQERHMAINWLLGESELYSETDTST